MLARFEKSINSHVISFRQFISCLLVLLVYSTYCKGQDVVTTHGPNSITRNIIQDRKGNMWIASWEGVFRYDGESFTNVTKGVSSARFFSVLEDREGNLWFGSIGAGVYYYNGQTFKNFTIKEGLLNNDVGSIYEDKKGNIWFGVFGGASRYDGKDFRNFIINGETMNEDHTGKTFAERPPYEVTSIIEDKTGKLWFATRNNTFVYDGTSFTVFKKNDGSPFKNVRTIMEDKKGNIWLAGNDGLWRYDGRSFTNFTKAFVGYVYEDKKGNIWTSSDIDKNAIGLQNIAGQKGWKLSRYDEKSLFDKNAEPKIIRANEEMVFGIVEASDGSIWFGTMNGVHRYNGNIITDFNRKKTQK